jgi:hypothetical protein
MSDVNNLFPQDKQSLQLETKRSQLKEITRENAGHLLTFEDCPLCKTRGRFTLFSKGPHVGIACAACGREHPFRRYSIQWLPA